MTCPLGFAGANAFASTQNQHTSYKRNILVEFRGEYYFLKKLFSENSDGVNYFGGYGLLMNVGVKWVMDVYVRGRDGCRIGGEMGVM